MNILSIYAYQYRLNIHAGVVGSYAWWQIHAQESIEGVMLRVISCHISEQG